MFRVLIVDDDAVQLRLTSEVAARAGFQPITATSGQQALDLLRADLRIGAVVLDLVMPDLDGMAVLEQMRHGRIATPVIVQTADPSLETVVTAMRQGASSSEITTATAKPAQATRRAADTPTARLVRSQTRNTSG